jgi:hypothetical protein
MNLAQAEGDPPMGASFIHMCVTVHENYAPNRICKVIDLREDKHRKMSPFNSLTKLQKFCQSTETDACGQLVFEAVYDAVQVGTHVCEFFTALPFAAMRRCLAAFL